MHNLVPSIKFSSTVNPLLQVCIVGAGPAAFYAAQHLAKNKNNIKIDIIEKLPVPFGLIRYGVAPDHPEVKNVINTFTKVAKQPNINFYGNITLGKDVVLKQLQQNYNAVLLTYGAEKDRMLGIENENVADVIAARNFVGWYNGLPSDRHLKVDLSGNTVAVIGQGNVALDVARILLSPVDDLRKTDITEHALNALAESNIKELYLIGRRGPLQAAFTIKELREQLKKPNCRTVWKKEDFDGVADIVPNLPRPRKRLTELMLNSADESFGVNHSENCKYFKPVFFRSPLKFLLNNKSKLNGIELGCNKIVGVDILKSPCVQTGDIEVLNCDLAFRSIGYKSIKVDEHLNFDDKSGMVVNSKGRVLDTDINNERLGQLYVAGWLGTGPVGVILHTMGNAFMVARSICEDLDKNTNLVSKGGFEEIRKILPSTTEIVDWAGWERIDKFEIEMGKNLGKPREKVCSIEKMLEIAK